MIPILFAPGTTDFSTNGIGRLIETTSCIVKEALNGIYELEMQYPVTGMWFNEIKHSCIIYALNYDGGSAQAFRIYEITVPINGLITVYGEHISYQTNWIPVEAFEASSLQDCLEKLKSKSAETNPFTFSTDKSVVSPISFLQPKSLRKMLGGEEGSILQTYKGEYEWNNYNIKLWNKRGSDNGVTLRYGKNITTIEQDTNIENTYTGVYPYWYDEEAGILITLPEKVVHSSQSGNFPYQRTAVVDFSDKFDEEPTIDQLRNITNTYIEQNNIGHPNISIDVEFVQLWQSNEYKDIQPLEYVKLGDTVTVIFETLGIEEKSEVIEYEFDVLKERYNSVKIGDPKSTLANTIAEVAAEIEIAREESKSYAAKATYWLTKGDGYLYIVKGSDGTWRELIAMDTPNKDTAKKVLRINQYGIGFSDSGVNGEFYQAWTLDGRLTLGGVNNSYGEFELLDAKGNVIGRLNKEGIYFGSTGSALQMDGTTTEVGTSEAKVITIDAGGFRIYNPTRTNNFIIASYDNTGITLYDPTGRGRDNDKLASYKTNGITFYKNGKTTAEIADTGIKMYENGYLSTEYNSLGLRFYYRNRLGIWIHSSGVIIYDSSGTRAITIENDGIYLYNRGHNILSISSNGISVGDSNGRLLGKITNDNISFYKNNILAFTIGAEGITVRNTSKNANSAVANANGFTVYNTNLEQGRQFVVSSLTNEGMLAQQWRKLSLASDGSSMYDIMSYFNITSSGLTSYGKYVATSSTGDQYLMDKFYLYVNENGLNSYARTSSSATSNYSSFSAGNSGLSLRNGKLGSYYGSTSFTVDRTGLTAAYLKDVYNENYLYLNYTGIKTYNDYNGFTPFEISPGLMRVQNTKGNLIEANADSLGFTLKDSKNQTMTINLENGFRIAGTNSSLRASQNEFTMTKTNSSGNTSYVYSITPESGITATNTSSSSITGMQISYNYIQSSVQNKTTGATYYPFRIQQSYIEVDTSAGNRARLDASTAVIRVEKASSGSSIYMSADSLEIGMRKSNGDKNTINFNTGFHYENSDGTKVVEVSQSSIKIKNGTKGWDFGINGNMSVGGYSGVSAPNDSPKNSRGKWNTFDVIGGIKDDSGDGDFVFSYDPVYSLTFYNGILVYWEEQ